jgi:hypothetical protein
MKMSAALLLCLKAHTVNQLAMPTIWLFCGQMRNQAIQRFLQL